MEKKLKNKALSCKRAAEAFCFFFPLWVESGLWLVWGSLESREKHRAENPRLGGGERADENHTRVGMQMICDSPACRLCNCGARERGTEIRACRASLLEPSCDRAFHSEHLQRDGRPGSRSFHPPPHLQRSVCRTEPSGTTQQKVTSRGDKDRRHPGERGLLGSLRPYLGVVLASQ